MISADPDWEVTFHEIWLFDEIDSRRLATALAGKHVTNAGQQTVKLGSQWTAERVHKLGQSKLWGTSVIFITWDDWCGWYDHVDPPLKEKWTGSPATGPSYTNSQFSYGTRGRVPRDQPLLEARNCQGISFAREPSEVLRGNVWAEATERERSDF